MLVKIDRGMMHIEKGILAVAILGIASISIANVFARNMMGGSLPFAEESNRVFMIWITFAGIGLGARQARHIRMAAFYDQLQGSARKVLWMTITAGTSLLMFILAWFSLQYLLHTFAIGGVTPALRVPVWTTYLIVPLGLVLGGLEYALTFLRNLKSDRLFLSLDLEEGTQGESGTS